MAEKIYNFVLFQLSWFACVLGGAHGLPWFGPLAVGGFVALHLSRASRPLDEAWLLVGAALIGMSFDSLLVVLGWLAYPSGQWHPALAPYWIVTMWVAFAATLNASLSWLKGRALTAALFGAVGGPLAYLAGEKLGGVVFVDRIAALAMLAVGWGLIMPILVRLAGRFDGWPARTSHQPLAAAAE
jgi:hypothetical protein